jgi:hypothetical protein
MQGKTMTRKLLIVSLLLSLAGGLLAGCDTYEWQKPGGTDAEFKTDRDSCMAAGNAQFKNCMNNLGWQFKQ